MAGVDHVLVLLATTTFRLELVADYLVVGPPLGTLDVFHHWVDLNVAISCRADRKSVRDGTGNAAAEVRGCGNGGGTYQRDR
jgi:hypothetical protein